MVPARRDRLNVACRYLALPLAVAAALLLARVATSDGSAKAGGVVTRHLEYVFDDGSYSVYDIDRNNAFVRRVSLPEARGIRGVAVTPGSPILYVSFGGDGGSNGNGSLLAYDIVREQLLWTRTYDTGVDSFALSRNGKWMYMPTGELDSGGRWLVIDTRNGSVTRTIEAGAGPHNTIVSLDGQHVYLGGRSYPYLEVASTHTNHIIRRIGPLKDGVRPFTINRSQTLAFTTATGFLGFQVSSIPTGKVLHTVTFPGFTYDPGRYTPSAPSHGISLTPDERRLFVIDGPNSYVHAFDVSHLPRARPRLIANIRLQHPLTGIEEPCTNDCERDGWLQASRDGRFIYVGDSGDVIDARTLHVAGFLAALRETRKMLEIDWRGSKIVATTTRYGLGYGRR